MCNYYYINGRRENLEKPWKALAAACLIILMLPSLAGCFKTYADDLYCLPVASEENVRLQGLIKDVSAGAEYSPPSGGSNRQAVQAVDLDGDGVNEVLAFFSGTGENPQKICIFKKDGDEYETRLVIEGAGTAIESVRYIDMDGDGWREIVVGWQIEMGIQHMNIYSIKEYNAVKLAGAEYSAITNFDIVGDGSNAIVCLKLPTPETPGEAETFILMPDGEMVSRKAQLSAGVEAISRVIRGRLATGAPAIFVESRINTTNVVTDVLVNRGDRLVNISISATSGISDDTLRALPIYCQDIDGDGRTELPIPRLLKAQSQTNYYSYDWYAYYADGSRRLSYTTYHNNSDGWFLIIPSDWRERVSIRREDSVQGERTLVFSFIGDADDEYLDFLKIYTLSGDDREDRARLSGRFRLRGEGEIVFAAELLSGAELHGLTMNREIVSDNFRLIISEWIIGAG